MKITLFIFTFIFILIFISTSFAQFTIKYETSIPQETIGPISDGMVVTENGYVYFVGYSRTDSDYFTLLKIDQTGQIVWQRDFIKPLTECGLKSMYITIDYDDNIVIICFQTNGVVDPDCFSGYRVTIAKLAIVKYDPEGNLLWRTDIDQDVTYGTGLNGLTIDKNNFIYIINDYHGSYCNSSEDTYNSEVYGINSSGVHTFTEQLVLTQLRSVQGLDSSAVAIGDVIRTVHCVDPVYPTEEWDNLETKMVMYEFTSSGLSTTLYGPLSMHSCDIDICGRNNDPPARCETNAWRLAVGGPSSNITVHMHVQNSAFYQGYYGDEYYYLGTYTPEGALVDIFEFDEVANLLEIDSQGDLVIVCDGPDYKSKTVKCTPYGDTLWSTIDANYTKPHIMILDKDDYIYQFEGSAISLLNPDGGIEWDCPVYSLSGANYFNNMKLDNSGKIYLFSYYEHNQGYPLVVYDNKKKLLISDGSEDNDPIADSKFWLIKMQNDIPNLTEDTLGQFTTDENGEFELNIAGCGEFEFIHDLYNGSTSDIISGGDTIKIAKHVDSKDAVKHSGELGTMYSVYLDNATFKINGAMVFDILDNTAKQEIILNHSEFRYNLLISVEWDASLNYQTILEENIQYMSNFLYDITDGQLRLDTICIFDDKQHWFKADIRIKANNMIHPHCRHDVAGISFPSESGQGREIIMPRKWFGDTCVSRNSTEDDIQFYALAYQDYVTKAHEFGHYALGFYDEYRLWDDDQDKYRTSNELKCGSLGNDSYGFMDFHYPSGQPFSSEMSSKYRYEDSECQNTEHYRNYAKSCWDHFETWVEAFTWGPENIYVPLLKPDLDDSDERHDIGTNYLFTGPNDNLEDLDYDVGRLIHFTETPSLQNPGFGNVHIRVASILGGKGADVTLINSPYDPPNLRYIEQGQTADNARMKVLGVKTAENEHIIQAWKSGTQWNVIVIPKSNGYSSSGPYACGTATAGKSGIGMSGNSFKSSSSGDTLDIELRLIQGDYPIINDVSLAESSMDFNIQFSTPFLSNPTLDLVTDYDFQNSYTLNPDGDIYSQTIADSLGCSGYFTVWAIDEASLDFFFVNDYIYSVVDSTSKVIRISDAGEHCEVVLDSLNTSIDNLMIVSSSYPVPTGSFADNTIKVGKTHTFSYYPVSPLTGDNQIYISYSDSELDADSITHAEESSLGIYQWNGIDDTWDYLGGSVDSSLNIVTESITGPGVYAVFATDYTTGFDDYGEILPYKFELSQNYPNPFNPVTTISYSLPRRSEVSIDIFNILGQKIITLVNETKPAGDYQINWSGNDSNGQKVSTGIYFYRFQAGNYVETKKMILLK